MTTIYTDGSCIRDPRGNILGIGWAYQIMTDTETICASGRVDPELDAYQNIAGEVTAVIEALLKCGALGIKAVSVHYDYQGLAAWVGGEWRARSPLAKHYVEIVRNSGITITWVKVKAHSGDRKNDAVDRAAKRAAVA